MSQDKSHTHGPGGGSDHKHDHPHDHHDCPDCHHEGHDHDHDHGHEHEVHDHHHGPGETHSHSHPHTHAHSHGPGHSHTHPHTHGPTTAPTPLAPDENEEAGARALADALRSSFAILKVVMVVLVLVFLGSGIFTVEPGQRAVILRFGKAIGEGESALKSEGIHWAWPYPIDEVQKIPFNSSETVVSSIGWYKTTATQEAQKTEDPPGPTLNPATDGYILTSDGNIAHVRATLRYRIGEPLKYIFDFSNTSNLVKNALNQSLTASAAEFTIDAILGGDATGFRDSVETRFRRLTSNQNLGITVENISIQTIPPRQLATEFSSVTEAIQRQTQVINDARKQADEIVTEANNRAMEIENEALEETTRAIQVVNAEAKRFKEFLPAYKENPALFRERLVAQTMQRVLQNAPDKYFMPNRTDGKPRELRLLLNREIAAPPAPEANTKKKDKDH